MVRFVQFQKLCEHDEDLWNPHIGEYLLYCAATVLQLGFATCLKCLHVFGLRRLKIITLPLSLNIQSVLEWSVPEI